jgi:hypothetical protein
VKQHRGDRYQEQYERYSHPSFILAIKGCGSELKGELTSLAVADSTFAIVVSLASPIRPVAKSTHDTEDTSRPLISQELGGVQNFKMIPVEAAVNSLLEGDVHALVRRV